jgi:hypothetical protein
MFHVAEIPVTLNKPKLNWIRRIQVELKQNRKKIVDQDMVAPNITTAVRDPKTRNKINQLELW